MNEQETEALVNLCAAGVLQAMTDAWWIYFAVTLPLVLIALALGRWSAK